MLAGDFIKMRRIQLDLTQKQVADAIGVSEGTVSRWESGDINNMRRDRIFRLAHILQVPPVKLLQDEIASDDVEPFFSDRQHVFISGFAGSGKSSVIQNLIAKYSSLLDPNSELDQNGQVFQLLTAYDHLNDEGQEKLVDYADDLVSSGKYKKHDSDCLAEEEA